MGGGEEIYKILQEGNLKNHILRQVKVGVAGGGKRIITGAGFFSGGSERRT